MDNPENPDAAEKSKKPVFKSVRKRNLRQKLKSEDSDDEETAQIRLVCL